MKRPEYNRFIVFGKNYEHCLEIKDKLNVLFSNYSIIGDDVIFIKVKHTKDELSKKLETKSLIEIDDLMLRSMKFEDENIQSGLERFVENTNPLEINQENADKILERVHEWGSTNILNEEEKFVLHEFSKKA